MKQSLESYRQLKGERNYWLYLISCAFSRMGDSIDAIAYSWIAYQLTGSPVWLTIIIGVNALPTVLITPFVAPLVERMNKKRVMVATSLFRAGMVLLTGMLMLLDLLTAPMLLAATLLISISESCADPAYMASVPQIIPREKLDAGIALRSMTSQTAQLIGSGLGGVCIGLWGGGGALLVDGSLFVLASLVLTTLRLAPRTEASDASGQRADGYLQTLKAGFRYFLHRPPLVLLCLLSVGFNILLSPMNQLQTAYVVDTLHLDAYALSVIGVANAAGMLLGSLAYPLLKKRLTIRRVTVYCGMTVVLDYAALVLLSLVKGMAWFQYAALFVTGLVMPMTVALFSLMGNVLFFQVIEEGYLSRMASIFNALGMAAVPLASVYSGALVSLMPITRVYLASAGLTLLATLAVSRLKAMRGLEALATPDEKEAACDEAAL